MLDWYFVAQLLLSMHTTFFSAGSVVASAGEVADRLMIIVSGRVKVLFSLKGYSWD